MNTPLHQHPMKINTYIVTGGLGSINEELQKFIWSLREEKVSNLIVSAPALVVDRYGAIVAAVTVTWTINN